jgi:hypothetical protein
MSTLEEIGIWASIAAAVFAGLAVVVQLLLRWWDRRSHIDIDYRMGVGAELPYEWLVEWGGTTPTDPVVMFRVENVGMRNESLSDVYVSVPGGRDVRHIFRGNPPKPSQLQPGFPCVFQLGLQGFARILVNEGCTGTARVELVIRLGRGSVHTKRIEIPDVEDKVKG